VAAGVAVTVQKALKLPVVYDCCQVLSQTVGTLPWGIFERKPDGSKPAMTPMRRAETNRTKQLASEWYVL
jgi:phage portal protein BeeE